ncbi:MAG TPA: UvrD-helicase domain-containing protein [Terriglobia bacterium]|nr:UvrD-helicase domain-containing protein [Terriglobia bacterium]
MLDLERRLNPQQKEAVVTTEGPLLILAGAGSGKTRVITFRVAHLIENLRIRPDQILAMTFTNKAAEQMKSRVSSLLQTQREGTPWISTFHSFCVKILRRYIEAIGYKRDFTIYDELDQQTLVKNVLKEMDIDDPLLTPRFVLSQISNAKNHRLSPEDMYGKAYAPQNEKIAVAFDLYEKKLKRANAVDFDDLLLKSVEVLNSHQPALDALSTQFHYIMVDEYQDTNRIQYELIRLLTSQRKNLCVVGDEDQSIYGWRGADIQNILRFEKDFPLARIIKLEQNYRSTGNILDAASAVVSNNRTRKGKALWTEEKGGDLITFYQAIDSEAEAIFVAEQALAYLRAYPADSIAVLYRTNFQSRLFEEACRRKGVEYCVVGGFSFYERAEVKDLLAYLKLSINPNDSVSLIRVINTPPRGIGKTTLDWLEAESRRRGLSLWEIIQTALEERSLPLRSLNALSQFQNTIQGFVSDPARSRTASFTRRIILESGYASWLKEEGTEESQTRLENLEELVNAARDSELRQEALSEFLDHAALVSETDDYDERAKVTLLTLHSAKGLEFSSVFIVGLEEGLFPHSRSLDSEQEMEEERRLCYVGMTRACKRLVLTQARKRRFLGNESMSETKPSRFLREIPAGLMVSTGIPQTLKKPIAYQGATCNTSESIQEFYRKRGIQIDLSPSKKALAGGSGFSHGTAVRHPQYGIGTVLRIEGEGDACKLTISFPGYGLKKMVKKYAKLEKA